MLIARASQPAEPATTTTTTTLLAGMSGTMSGSGSTTLVPSAPSYPARQHLKANLAERRGRRGSGRSALLPTERMHQVITPLGSSHDMQQPAVDTPSRFLNLDPFGLTSPSISMSLGVTFSPQNGRPEAGHVKSEINPFESSLSPEADVTGSGAASSTAQPLVQNAGTDWTPDTAKAVFSWMTSHTRSGSQDGTISLHAAQPAPQVQETAKVPAPARKKQKIVKQVSILSTPKSPSTKELPCDLDDGGLEYKHKSRPSLPTPTGSRTPSASSVSPASDKAEIEAVASPESFLSKSLPAITVPSTAAVTPRTEPIAEPARPHTESTASAAGYPPYYHDSPMAHPYAMQPLVPVQQHFAPYPAMPGDHAPAPAPAPAQIYYYPSMPTNLAPRQPVMGQPMPIMLQNPMPHLQHAVSMPPMPTPMTIMDQSGRESYMMPHYSRAGHSSYMVSGATPFPRQVSPSEPDEQVDDDQEHNPDSGTKRNKFLERNRVAASKCRQKKKQYVQHLQYVSEDLTRRNAHLHQMVHLLREECLELREQLVRQLENGCGREGTGCTNTAVKLSQPAPSTQTVAAASGPKPGRLYSSSAVGPAIHRHSDLLSGPRAPREPALSRQ